MSDAPAQRRRDVTPRTRYTVPRPFLKWVGGKGQLLGDLLGHIDRLGRIGRYHEPFLGGGALFFEMQRSGRLGRKQAWLSDRNEDLIETWLGVKEEVDAVIERLAHHRERHDHDFYYELRAAVPEARADRAARIIYINKTGYNGLYRVNSKGQINVPFGRYKNPKILDEPNLRGVSVALKQARVSTAPFERVLREAKAGDLVYFDPPYVPVSDTAYFTSYSKYPFGMPEQEHLADTFRTLAKKGVHVMLSNSFTDAVKELYSFAEATVHEVRATRNVNSNAARRGKVSEALVTSF